MKKGPRRWFILQKFLHLFFGEKIIAVINGLISHPYSRYIAERLAPTLYEHVCCVIKIGVDMPYFPRPLAFIDHFRRNVWRGAESHDDTVYVGLLTGFAVPSERAVREVDMHTFREKRFPQNGY